jgi:drug/metabolite transporter (DMT)-like permease
LVARSESPPRRAYAAWLSVCLIWGTTYLAIRIALETIPPTLTGGIRFVIAGAILCLLVRIRGGRLPPLREWPRQALLGTLLLALGNGCVVWAERWIPSGIAAVGVAALPFWMAGTEVAFGGERIGVRAIAGLATGFGGILVLIWPSLLAPDVEGSWFAVGVVLVQIACVSWAIGSSLQKRTRTATSVAAASAVQQVFAGVIMVGVGGALGEWHQFALNPRTLAAEVYLIVLGSLVAYSAFLYALAHLPITTVSLYAYVNPVIAVLLGSIVAAEPFTPRVVVSAALVLTGVTIVRRVQRGGS